MALSFGISTGAAPSFGASAPAFGASSTPNFAFGASSAPAFGTFASTTFVASSSAFQLPSSTPAFGAAIPTSPFGATPSLFGASSAATFGAASAPAFGAASAPSLFSASAASTSSTPAFSFGSAPAATQSAFGSALALPGQQQQQQQQAASNLITYTTKYDDLNPQHQQVLLEIQREISSYREDCEKLDQDVRLHDSTALKRSMEEETSNLTQSLQAMWNAVKADDEAVADFHEKVHRLLRSTEHAVYTFQRSKLWREAPQLYKGQIMPPQVQEVLASPVILPSPYLEQAVAGFQETASTYRQCINELEQAMPRDEAMRNAEEEDQLIQSLPTVISHMHDYFVHVAARMEAVHKNVQKARAAYLAQHRSLGDLSDPFEESRRQTDLSLSSGKPIIIPPALPSHNHHLPSGTAAGGPASAFGATQAPALLGAPSATPGLPGAASGTSPFSLAAATTPFGAPAGAPGGQAGGDMSRKGTGSSRRRK